MYSDFKESIILLTQHPILHSRSLEVLTEEERERAYILLTNLLNQSVDEDYTLIDNIQMARLEYNLAELAYLLDKENSNCIIHHYKSALYHLTKGGIDLSINKWAELVSLHSIE